MHKSLFPLVDFRVAFAVPRRVWLKGFVAGEISYSERPGVVLGARRVAEAGHSQNSIDKSTAVSKMMNKMNVRSTCSD